MPGGNQVNEDKRSEEIQRPAGRKTTTRRRFLLIAAGAVGATMLVGGGALAVGLQEPPLELPNASYGKEDAMGQRILVAYASKCGSTGETAQTIAEVLSQSGIAVDVRLAKEVKELSPYRAVVLGSAVRMGRLLGEVEEFAKTNQSALSNLPTAYFTLCTTMKEDTPANRETVTGYFASLRAIKEPVALGLFAGKVDHSTLPPLWRFFASRDKSGAMAEGDYRDWPAIHAWAAQVGSALVGG
jgi:menaquinone-dependent protoporphyrinogen oxidase